MSTVLCPKTRNLSSPLQCSHERSRTRSGTGSSTPTASVTSCAAQSSDQEPAWCFQGHQNRVLNPVSECGKQLQQLQQFGQSRCRIVDSLRGQKRALSQHLRCRGLYRGLLRLGSGGT